MTFGKRKKKVSPLETEDGDGPAWLMDWYQEYAIDNSGDAHSASTLDFKVSARGVVGRGTELSPVQSGQQQGALRTDAAVRCQQVRFSPCGTLVVTNKGSVVNAESGEEVYDLGARLKGTITGIEHWKKGLLCDTDVCMSPDGRYLLETGSAGYPGQPCFLQCTPSNRCWYVDPLACSLSQCTLSYYLEHIGSLAQCLAPTPHPPHTLLSATTHPP